jgi:hypothetical protein
VDADNDGGDIVVTNGIYSLGGRPASGQFLTNRVVVEKPLTLRSVNGPKFTIIQGYQVPITHNGDAAVRCVYVDNGASLSGFTLTNGATLSEGSTADLGGGGVWCDSQTTVISNCVLAGNSAVFGGGAAGGSLKNCTLSRNLASSDQWKWNGYGGGAAGSWLKHCVLSANSAGAGGGAAGGTLNDCLLTNNSAIWGGGAYGEQDSIGTCTLTNCTLTRNSAQHGGGTYSRVDVAPGDWFCSLYNCIVYFNDAADAENCYGGTLLYCCATPPSLNEASNNNVTNAPLFVDLAGGNLRLQSNSPCINAGNNLYFSTLADLDGNPRVVGETVDIGAYEFQHPASVISYAWLQQYGLPTDGSADYTDPDRDGMNNWQEWIAGSCPTNTLSVLRLMPPSLNGTNLVITWQSVSRVNYSLERSTNLAGPFTTLADGLGSLTGETTFTDTNFVCSGVFFYRVRVDHF